MPKIKTQRTIEIMPSSGSTRWCPTAEQLMILEEIYKGLLRTPNASQMQQITAHLSQYGKIEGKNVFYWFQNHKARDRQRLRKKQLYLAKQMQNQQQQQQNYHRELDHVLQCTSAPPLDPSLNFHYKSPAFPNQGGGVEDACYSEIMKHYNWKLDLPVETCMNKTVKTKYGDDGMRLTKTITKDVGPSIASTPCCSRGSPQTLQLFPTKSTHS